MPTTTLSPRPTKNGKPATSTAGHNHNSETRRAAHIAPSFDTLPDTAYLRQPQLLEIVPFSAATLWRKCKAGEFPQPVKLSKRVTAWQVGAVRRFIQVQSTGASS